MGSRGQRLWLGSAQPNYFINSFYSNLSVFFPPNVSVMIKTNSTALNHVFSFCLLFHSKFGFIFTETKNTFTSFYCFESRALESNCNFYIIQLWISWYQRHIGSKYFNLKVFKHDSEIISRLLPFITFINPTV